MRRLRILCLHGYHGSANILRQQMEPLFGDLRSAVDFVEVDAPAKAHGDFGWWHGNFPSSHGAFRNWDLTRDRIVELFEEEGPFDGVFGFSQGAALTGLLAGLRAPDGKVSARTPISFEFAIMAGGFLSEAPAHQELYAAKAGYRIPSIHLIGTSDLVVRPADSLSLAGQFESPEILEHPGGHVISAAPAIRERVATFLGTWQSATT